TRDENARSGEIPYKNDVSNASISLNYGEWKLNLGAYENTKSKFGLVPTLVSTGDRKLEGYYLDSGYSWKLGEKADLSIYGYYDSLAKDELISWYPPAYAQQQAGVGGPENQTYKGTKYGFTVQSSYQFTQDWRMLGGLFGEFQKTGPYEFRRPDGTFSAFNTSAWRGVDHDANNKGGFVQIDGRLSQTIGVVSGVRYTQNNVYGSSITPSLGLVLNATPNLTFKALYGSGSRDPNFFELYVATVNVLNGNTDLKPEKVKSYELGMDYVFGSYSLRVNAFLADTSDLIARSLMVPAGVNGNTRPTPKYGNIDGQKLSGIEAELKGSFHSSERHFVNISLLKGTEKANSVDVMFIPKVLANVGVNWSPVKAFTISPYFQYVGAKEGTLTNGTPVQVSSYTLANLNIEYRFDAFWLSLTGKNLFDKAYANPEYIRRLVPETPGGPGRSVYLQIGFRK
ncbi:MAG: TonB-dependent receptor, partial [Holophaga sp.]|nr:TonB-dependent receptor [Holophaga sp.]